MKQSTDMDEIYRKLSPENIPWNIEEPPAILVRLLNQGLVQPCKTIEFGCGLGNYARYLSSRGFDVTGVDISPTAIRIAQERTKKEGLRCTFIAADVLGDMDEVPGTFDFAFDWEVLHHIFPENRKKYVQNVFSKLNPQAGYCSLCFSDQDPQFGGVGKYRETPIGTVLYFSSEDELRALFEPYFLIEDMRTIEVSGKGLPHLAVYVFMKRREEGYRWQDT